MARFEYKIKATAPGHEVLEIVQTADTEKEAVDIVKEYASDYLGVREEHLVIFIRNVNPLF